MYPHLCPKGFLETLPFVNDKFTLYNNEDMRQLIETSTLVIRELVEKTDEVKSKTGELVERAYSMVKMIKK